jgi:hypothetical protein
MGGIVSREDGRRIESSSILASNSRIPSFHLDSVRFVSKDKDNIISVPYGNNDSSQKSTSSCRRAHTPLSRRFFPEVSDTITILAQGNNINDDDITPFAMINSNITVECVLATPCRDRSSQTPAGRWMTDKPEYEIEANTPLKNLSLILSGGAITRSDTSSTVQSTATGPKGSDATGILNKCGDEYDVYISPVASQLKSPKWHRRCKYCSMDFYSKILYADHVNVSYIASFIP